MIVSLGATLFLQEHHSGKANREGEDCTLAVFALGRDTYIDRLSSVGSPDEQVRCE